MLLGRDSAVPSERLVVDAGGAAASFSSEEAARAYARERGLVADDDAPEEVDLDAVAAWCGRFDRAPLDPKAVWAAWDFLGRTGALEERPVDTHGYLDEINLKLVLKIGRIDRPDVRDRIPEPEMTTQDLRNLARLLTHGTTELTRRLSTSATL